MQTYISEAVPIRTIQHMIDEAKALGLRVVHRPDPKPSNVVLLHAAAHESRQAHVSPEAA